MSSLFSEFLSKTEARYHSVPSLLCLLKNNQNCTPHVRRDKPTRQERIGLSPSLADLMPVNFAILLIMMGILLVLGFFIDWVGIMLLTMPIFVPIVRELAPEFGLDPQWAAIWFGILFCMNMQISYLSPPFGPAAFYLKGVAPPEITLQDIYNSLWPFMGLQILALALVMKFPQLALWLPMLQSVN